LASFSWISLAFRRCKLCARLASCDRSHSHELEESGRPKTVRKYELALKLLSGKATARVPRGNPSKLLSDFVV